MNTRRDFLEKSATLAALGFLPRQISADEWLAERDRSVTPKNFKGKACVISAANGYNDAGHGDQSRVRQDRRRHRHARRDHRRR